MSYVNNFLNRLQKVKQVGDDKYTALCPVHDDNNPSMEVRIVEDKILAYCFACGAKAPAIAEAVAKKHLTCSLVTLRSHQIETTG